MAKFEYDESGGTSLYFLVSFYALVLFPLTYYLWPSKQKKDDPEKSRKACHCDPCEAKRAQIKAPSTSSTVKNVLRWIFLFIAWAVFILIALKASQVERDHIEYDPFEILQVDRGATEAEIKRQYRKLSKQFHPDKEGGNAEMFMRIAKAHAALTDEESRRNWEEHGNPDGRQATQFGIALPAWIVDQNNSVWVLAAYGLAFMVILPITVGTWWYRSIRYTAVEILIDTTQLFQYYLHKTPCMNLKRALIILSGSFEFDKRHNSKVVVRPSDNEEVPKLVREFEINIKNKEKPFCFPYSVKVRSLIHAHLARSDHLPEPLDQDRLYMVKKCPQLVQEMVNTAAQLIVFFKYNGGNPAKEPKLQTIEHIMKLSPMIIQATWDKSPLMQLPHFTEETLRLCQSKKRNIRSIGQFIRLKDTDKRYILRHLDERQYQDVLNVCASLPLIDADITLEVHDDEDKATITAGAIVTAAITLRRENFTIPSEDDVSSTAGMPALESREVAEEREVSEKDSPMASKNKPKVWEKQQKKKKVKGGAGGGGGNKPKPKKQQPKKAAGKAAILNANGSPAKEALAEDDDQAVDQGDRSGAESDDEIAQNSASSDDEEGMDEKGEGAGAGGDEEEWEALQTGLTRKEKVLEGISKESHEVHSPYFPDVKNEWWWVYLADRKSLRMVTSPSMVYDLKGEKEIQLQFKAPAKGFYQYALCVRSDSYLDLDLVKTIKVDVKEAKKIDEFHPQWDISDEEKDDDAEDSAVTDFSSDDEDSDEE